MTDNHNCQLVYIKERQELKINNRGLTQSAKDSKKINKNKSKRPRRSPEEIAREIYEVWYFWIS